ncbi:MAG: ABC transporter permease [Candidatus Lokiarchaeia archaeon]
MIFKKIRRVISKTSAIVEKNIQMRMRFKYKTILSYITPILTILITVIIMDKFFDYNIKFDPWTSENYMVFVFIGYNILLMRGMINLIPQNLMIEKYWKTLPALITAPFNRFYLLFGYIFSEILGIIIPFTVFLIITFIYYPISFLTFIIIIIIFLGISIIFSGIGLLLGAFAISNENLWSMLDFIARTIFWFSCISYPFYLYPKIIQNIIDINPIYYIIDIIRWTWIEDNILMTVQLHPVHILIFISLLIIFPIICVYTFNYIYKKLGISGY